MTKRKNGECTADVAEALQYVDYLFPNDAEAMLLTGKNTVEGAAEDLLSAGVGTVVIKCGEMGCYIRNREREFCVCRIFYRLRQQKHLQFPRHKGLQVPEICHQKYPSRQLQQWQT